MRSADRSGATEVTSFRLPWETLSDDERRKLAEAVSANPHHPLLPAVDYARTVADDLHRHVRDYTCILIKRERIQDRLQDFQSMRVRLRVARPAVDNSPAVPLSVYLDFLGPPKIRGRKVLFVAGQNNGKMLARNGGKRFNYVIVRIDPRSDAALRESLVPISEMGFENMTQILIRLLDENIRHDPSGGNSHLAFYKNAKVNDRTCTRIAVSHPEQNAALGFNTADVFVDDELHIPIRLQAYGWPTRPDGPRPLLFEYTYEDIRLNVGLTSADFTIGLLEPKTPVAGN